MRKMLVLAGLLALSFGSGKALAFQEQPIPPTPGEDAEQSTQADTSAMALQLGSPNASPAAPKTDGGLNLFGYTVLPKLNFGLDVLYGQDKQELQLGDTDDLGTLDENGDVTVLGKVKRRF
jgi:hypothetical protein